MPPKLGILAGGGLLPAAIIEACRKTGRDYFVIAFEGQTDVGTVDGSPHAWVRLGAAGKAIRLLREAGVDAVVMAGSMRRPRLRDLRPDPWAAKFLARTGAFSLGDDGLFRALIMALETDEGFAIETPDSLVPELLATAGAVGSIGIQPEHEGDVRLAVKAAIENGRADRGQAAVARGGAVVGVEGRNGTDAMLRRLPRANEGGRGGVLAKVAKPGQDLRVDLPTIGVDTVRRADEAGLAGIVVEAGRSLILEAGRVGDAADAAGLFVAGVDCADVCRDR